MNFELCLENFGEEENKHEGGMFYVEEQYMTDMNTNTFISLYALLCCALLLLLYNIHSKRALENQTVKTKLGAKGEERNKTKI